MFSTNNALNLGDTTHLPKRMASFYVDMSGVETIHAIISRALEADEGALIGRNGTIELDLMTTAPHSKDSRPFILERNAGVFPMDRSGNFTAWREASIEATKCADALAMGWYEPLAEREAQCFKHWGVTAKPLALRDLEPYYAPYDKQWTIHLRNHTVAVVTSFAQTASTQVGRAHEIWGDRIVIPGDIEWRFIQTGHSPSVAKGTNEWPKGIRSWKDAVNHVVAEVVKTGARFALIGCGGLGMLIGKALKDRGVICVVMGGAIQVLFGIKGRRWETHPIISTFWNDAWVWPSATETPGAAKTIEGGCYWG